MRRSHIQRGGARCTHMHTFAHMQSYALSYNTYAYAASCNAMEHVILCDVMQCSVLLSKVLLCAVLCVRLGWVGRGRVVLRRVAWGCVVYCFV